MNNITTFDYTPPPDDNNAYKGVVLLIFIIYLVLLITLFTLVIVIAYKFPIIVTESKSSDRCISIFLAIIVFPAYLLILGIQQPIINHRGRTDVLLTMVIMLLFFPLYFCMRHKNYEVLDDSKYDDHAVV